ncbi:exopolyphosphatase / guanosine-5'-triphosphate,3'-diphosphate pyrophosphatase [Selenihalanaerobacter shriftii]|uniref:Exopolyphosphatase / guanosine-5'-triphosphate,3'-diphosphate pyrophosphatase n=2 Tax=Selenihalanaerobacter shriftii TaxID=142842 RepID=A0A1T4R563_9FIRM|nr:exopolyphosphatase / guanosine-5'-triphosphate,3'-diphosphate pyrophosphatase [Selenihalanaerobacter shriftii]
MAAIDIGTNSTRLLIGRLLETGQIRPLVTELRTTRLGDGVDASRSLKGEAMNRVIKALKEYKELINQQKLDKVRVVATSAVRDSSNQREFIKKVKIETGLEVDVISGEEEAELSYLGVIKGLSNSLLDANLVIDIGGGSTEFIFGSKNEIKERRSIDVGAVRMTEKFEEVEQRRDLIVRELFSITERFQNKSKILLGVGGTITTLAAIDQNLAIYNRNKVHGYSLGFPTVKKIFLDLKAKTISERKKVTGLQPKRADIIVAGIQILLEIMERLGKKEVVVSESDILDGIIYEYYK